MSHDSRPWFRGLMQSMHSSKNQESSSFLQADGSSGSPKRNPSSYSKQRQGGDVVAIFVHAGAGFHSLQNEKVHLQACEAACFTAMTFLNNGGTAVDAVEAAIKALEDNEVTNAGYGSNLAMDGAVECDATIVDHLGRSGAVGALRHVTNPIHVARCILDESAQPLSLRRVPPNLLVGEGASDYAHNHGIPILPMDLLISPGSKERWMKWTRDLDWASRHDKGPSLLNSREISALGNEAQPASPSLLGRSRPSFSERTSNSSPGSTGRGGSPPTPSRTPSAPSTPMKLRSPLARDKPPVRQPNLRPDIKRSEYSDDGAAVDPEPLRVALDIQDHSPLLDDRDEQDSDAPTGHQDDNVTDTVGAIAIDCFGNIAAGSSSGGIGMKHKGRMGPAALVGIGTAVHPINPDDKNPSSVACVTSGTGEHMASTTAASTCATRIYLASAGERHGSMDDVDEDEALQNFIKEDFMNHPSVRSSHSAGAIGIMAVKKTRDGVYLYYGHNTESFAVASMSSEDEIPHCTMSRIKNSAERSSCATGARKVCYRDPKQSGKRSASSLSLVDSQLDLKRSRWSSKASQLGQLSQHTAKSGTSFTTTGANSDYSTGTSTGTSTPLNKSTIPFTDGADDEPPAEEATDAEDPPSGGNPEATEREPPVAATVQPNEAHEDQSRGSVDPLANVTEVNESEEGKSKDPRDHSAAASETKEANEGSRESLVDASADNAKVIAPEELSPTDKAPVPASTIVTEPMPRDSKSIIFQKYRVARYATRIVAWETAIANRRVLYDGAKMLVQKMDARVVRDGGAPPIRYWRQPLSPQCEDVEVVEGFMLQAMAIAKQLAEHSKAEARLKKAQARLISLERTVARGYPPDAGIQEIRELRAAAKAFRQDAKNQKRFARVCWYMPPPDVSETTSLYIKALLRLIRQTKYSMNVYNQMPMQLALTSLAIRNIMVIGATT